MSHPIDYTPPGDGDREYMSEREWFEAWEAYRAWAELHDDWTEAELAAREEEWAREHDQAEAYDPEPEPFHPSPLEDAWWSGFSAAMSEVGRN